MKRVLSLLLAALFCTSLLFGCGEPKDDPVVDNNDGGNVVTTVPWDDAVVNDDTTVPDFETQSPTDETEYPKDDLDPGLNYKGEKFTILYWEDNGREEFNATEQSGALVEDALYNRDVMVQDRLGVEFEWVGSVGNFGNMAVYVTAVENDVKADGEYDVFASYSQTAATLALQGLSRDLMNVNHINFDQPWWPKSLTELSTVNDRLYFCSGDISTTLLNMMYCTFFNKDLAEELQLGDIYKIVDDGKWTLDKLSELGSIAYWDVNGNTICDSYDRFGVSLGSSVHFDAFYNAAGLITVDKDSGGTPVVAADFSSEKTQNLLEKVVDIFHGSTYAAFPDTVSGWKNKTFATGQALFMIDRNYVISTMSDITLPYGVLPVPKYDEAQDGYYTCMAFPFTMYSISIASSEEKADMSAAVLECMASESYRQVTPAVFEVSMKLKYATSAADSRMYDLIREAVLLDFGRLFNSPLELIPCMAFRNACINGQTNWSAIFKAQGRVMEQSLENIVETLNNRAS